ncbi:hypothetical protein HYPSUDRAFT_61398 [Hypholoma sublateritium FD-334 SS-4]|uniref:Uncharacterized protein n=1 Tax=Hypholoma sublateritium (strain FD-334 SS-4) TaxID=945553 RepID=A0A0D2MZ21_HYPSF|nr:hypothetical protein HYPSUDRAFT_61398 [Hypholoma sublateritium FD-334 SS-4]
MDSASIPPSLSVTQPNSPGSSVFDLPIQPTLNTSNNDASQARFPHVDVSRRDSADDNQPSAILISGGTGGNAICSAFDNACYILPVSDDGGSSSEIIRVIGGPSIGDIRSRLVRLIPPAPASSPLDAIRRLLAHRLSSKSSEREARDEWRDIVEGRSKLWKGIPSDRKETIRGFLVYFESELLKRAHKNFDFRNGSVGNYFLAAAQGFFRSLPSAIFLFSSITNSQAHILPVIVTNHTVTIAAELNDGEKLVGQCEISHPMPSEAPSLVLDAEAPDEEPLDSPVDDGLGEFASPRQNILFESASKGSYESLPSRIQRLYYINGYGMEIHPSPNKEFLSNLSTRNVLVYSCGSLWTSIIPCLALKGVAEKIARSHSLRAKVLLLNAENDRETDGYTAADYIKAISQTLNGNYSERAYGLGSANTTYPISAFITDLVYLKGSRVAVNVREITAMGVRCREIEGDTRFDSAAVALAMQQIWADVC